MKTLWTILIIVILLIGFWLCPYFFNGTVNLNHVKENASQTWSQMGYEINGYEGYQWGWGIGPYGGACVWYQLKKKPDNGILYMGYLQRWGDEIHVWKLRAIDAIKP